VYFNPQLNVKYQTGAEHFIALQYSLHNETGSIEDIYQGSILKDYRTLYANNANLTLRQNQQVSAGFSYHKAISLFFFNIIGSYNNSSANNIDSSIITNSLLQRVALPYHNNTGSWSLEGNISKYSFALHTTFSARAQWQNSRWLQIQNSSLLPFYTIAEKLELGAETKLNTVVNFSYHITGAETHTQSTATAVSSHIYQLVQQASVYYYPSTTLQFKLSGEHYVTGGQGNGYGQYFFADGDVKYRLKKWNTDLALDANNLFNVKTYKAVYLSANTLTSSAYTLPGRTIMMKLVFNL
jgi:outer membrane receptor for ferrienterochelin and colicin